MMNKNTLKCICSFKCLCVVFRGLFITPIISTPNPRKEVVYCQRFTLSSKTYRKSCTGMLIVSAIFQSLSTRCGILLNKGLLSWRVAKGGGEV